MEDNDLVNVKSKCSEQIQEYVKINNPLIFSLSSKDYLQGIHDNDSQRKDLFIAERNFMEFKNWLDNYVMEKIKGLNEKRIEEFEQIRKKAIAILNEEKEILEKNVMNLQDKVDNLMNRIDENFEMIQQRLNNLPCKDLATVFQDARETLEKLIK
jgi:gas vesicle protein